MSPVLITLNILRYLHSGVRPCKAHHIKKQRYVGQVSDRGKAIYTWKLASHWINRIYYVLWETHENAKLQRNVRRVEIAKGFKPHTTLQVSLYRRKERRWGETRWIRGGRSALELKPHKDPETCIWGGGRRVRPHFPMPSSKQGQTNGCLSRTYGWRRRENYHW